MEEILGYLKEFLTPQTMTTITAVLMFLVATLKLISMVKTLNKQKAMTLENVKQVLLSALKTQNQEEIQKAINEVLTPVLNAVNEINPYLQTFAKILALSQENTPTSRLAILELIENMGRTDIQLIENAKEVVNEEVKKEEMKKQETIEQLSEIERRPVE